MNTALLRVSRRLALVVLPFLLAGCAALAPDNAPRVEVAAIEPLPWRGPELRMLVRLRIVNPSDVAMQYDGAYLEINVNGQRFASGVTDAQGSVPRFSETVLEVPVTVTTMALVRQAIAITSVENSSTMSYQLRGKLSGPIFRSHRFDATGELKLPMPPHLR